MTWKSGPDPGEKSPGSEPLQRTISLAADTSIVAVVGPAEGVLAVAIRHPGTGQPVDRVVVEALCALKGTAGDFAAVERGAVLLDTGKELSPAPRAYQEVPSFQGSHFMMRYSK